GAQSTNPARLAFLTLVLAGRSHDLIKFTSGICPSAANCIGLIQLEHRTPSVGVENGITPCRLSACSMLSSVEATLVGELLPLFSQYRTDRGWHPAARARSACVSPASIRAARIWRPETMLLISRTISDSGMSPYFTNSLIAPTGLGLLTIARTGRELLGRIARGSVALRKMACRLAREDSIYGSRPSTRARGVT